MNQSFNLCFLLAFFFQIFLYLNLYKVRALDANTDRDALLSFRSAVSDPQDALIGWNSTSSHCSWLGVTCNATNMRVQSINLTGLGLSGTLPPQLSNLSSLQDLNLRNNSFHGAIPFELGQIATLRRIALGGNSLNGTLPVSFSNCYKLEEMSLEYNELTGNLPYQLGHLPSLRILDVSVNNISGTIPNSFGNLSSLTSLYLARNNLQGEIPSELGNLRNLTTLQLSINQLTEGIPLSLYTISSLTYLSLTNNKLLGTLPSYMGYAFPNLRRVFLSHNKLGGPLPGSLFNASSQIISLDLSYNAFQGSLPLFGNMTSLDTLHLGGNNLSSTTELNGLVFDSLKNCTHLKKLYLNSNQLAGDFPSSVVNLSASLEEFCIDDNFFTGSFPLGLENNQNLIALSINKNMFTGSIPNSLGMLRKLQKLYVHENMFSGEIPDMFGNLTQLYQVTMGYNKFSGRIPPSLAKCERLQLLGLAGNKLNGSIPREIFGLSNIINLQLARNSLTGSLPDEVGNLKQLSVVNVQDNQLSGNITATIGDCESLGTLNMARNKLVGSIPDSFGKLKVLETLNISSNSLSGEIPKELGNLTMLKHLNLSFNMLEGEVPRSGVFLNLSSDSLEGNGKLCGADKETSTKLGITQCSTERRLDTRLLLKILIPVFIFIMLLFGVSCAIWSAKTRKKEKPVDQGNLSSPAHGVRLPKKSYAEIRLATNGFAAENLIGKGAFGSVYRATFSDGTDEGHTTLAVKVLDLGQSQASKSFDAECEALRNVRHRNLVKVFTSCSGNYHTEGEFKALVMEFMSNGNLDSWLYPDNDVSGSYLNFSQRLDIAIDVASAIDYLHHDCDPPIVHCDLKPANVLLDDDMTAHVGDFGLARFLSENALREGNSTIGLKGSIGYIPPEYGLSGKVSTSGDAYSFGILLLEMFIAKKPTDEMFKDGLTLIEFASAVQENDRVLKIGDGRLFHDSGCYKASDSSSYSSRGNISISFNTSTTSNDDATSNWLGIMEENVASVIRIGLSCAAHSPSDRLSMREALAKLHELKKSVG